MDELMMKRQEGGQELRHTHTHKEINSGRGGEAYRMREPEIASVKQSWYVKEVQMGSAPGVTSLFQYKVGLGDRTRAIWEFISRQTRFILRSKLS